jgi:1,4-dihydroxy-2-naphthoyl-CoA hydrolase
VERPTFDTYDPAVAELMLRDKSGGDGLTDFLCLKLVDVGPGTATGEIEVRPELLQAFGAVHGGVVATLIDHVLGAAVFPSVPVGTWPATLEFKLNYLAAVRGGVIRATSQMLVLRKRTAVVQVDVTNEGRPVATALGTISLNPPKPG